MPARFVTTSLVTKRAGGIAARFVTELVTKRAATHIFTIITMTITSFDLRTDRSDS